MKLLSVLLLVADPLLIAFISSVIIGACIKNVDAVLFIKRAVSLILFLIYFLVYFYFVFIAGGVPKYIAMFAPIAVMIVFIIISVIAAPEDCLKKNCKGDYKMTGWDTMFPNDLDNYDKKDK